MKKKRKFEIELTKVTPEEVIHHLSKRCRLIEKRVYAWHSEGEKTVVLWCPRENQPFPTFVVERGIGVAIVDLNPMAKGGPLEVCFVREVATENSSASIRAGWGVIGDVGQPFHSLSSVQNAKWAKQFLKANGAISLRRLGLKNVYAVEAPVVRALENLDSEMFAKLVEEFPDGRIDYEAVRKIQRTAKKIVV